MNFYAKLWNERSLERGSIASDRAIRRVMKNFFKSEGRGGGAD